MTVFSNRYNPSLTILLNPFFKVDSACDFGRDLAMFLRPHQCEVPQLQP